MQDTDWITVVTQLEEQLLTAIVTLRELRQDIEYRRSTRPAPEQLVMTSEPPAVETTRRRTVAQVGRGKHHWTQFETDRMVSMWMRGIPLATIAAELDRTERAISDHARVLRAGGLALPKRDGIVKGIR